MAALCKKRCFYEKEIAQRPAGSQHDALSVPDVGFCGRRAAWGGYSSGTSTAQELDAENDVPADHRIEVSSGEELITAVNAINAGSGEYEIVLTNDIEVNQRVSFSNRNVILTVCSEGTQHAIRHTDLLMGSSNVTSWFRCEGMTVTFRNVAFQNEANFSSSYPYCYALISVVESAQLTLDHCLIDGGGGSSYSCKALNLWSNSSATLVDTTIQNCYTLNGDGCGGAGVYLYSSSLIMDHSTITDCSAIDTIGGNYYGGGGVLLYYGPASLTMENGSTITRCHTDGNGGGINVCTSKATITISPDSQIYNNTAYIDDPDGYSSGSDIFIKGGSITLPDVAAQNLTSADGHKIDGWYSDKNKDRYGQTKHVDALTDLSLNESLLGIVASYAVYDIAFDYSTTEGETDTCHAYKDAAAANGIVVAPTGDKVYLTYTGTALVPAADEALYWDVKDDAGTSVAVTPASGSTPAYFTMPEKPIGNKVTVTPTVVKVSDLPAAPGDIPSGDGGSGGSGDSGAAGIVAGALIGGATYLVGTDLWLNHLYGFIPENRIQLAEALWNKADCPAPVSAELYPDIDEDDTDAQAAARWCVEQGLMKDYSSTDKDGSEEVTFKPCGYVFRPQAIKAWYDLEKLLNEQQ